MTGNSVPSMTIKRKLTREEEGMADRMKAIISTTPGMTEELVGAAVGVSQGQVSHWTGRRLPVSAKRAPKLAQALGIKDPGEISVAYRELFAVESRPAPQSHSQPMRLDPVMIAQTHRVLRDLEHSEGRKFFLEDDAYAVWFAQVYEMRAAMSAQPSAAEWVEFGRKLQAITQGAVSNGRDDGVPNEGTGTRKVAGKVQRKA